MNGMLFTKSRAGLVLVLRRKVYLYTCIKPGVSNRHNSRIVRYMLKRNKTALIERFMEDIR